MKRLLLVPIFLIFTFFIQNQNLYSEEWDYHGFSEMKNEKIFYIFTKKSSGPENGTINFEQKHIFTGPEKLADGREYTSVLMERSLDCSGKSMTVEKITLSNGVGNKVETYNNLSGNIEMTISENRKFDLYLYNIYCKQ